MWKYFSIPVVKNVLTVIYLAFIYLFICLACYQNNYPQSLGEKHSPTYLFSLQNKDPIPRENNYHGPGYMTTENHTRFVKQTLDNSDKSFGPKVSFRAETFHFNFFILPDLMKWRMICLFCNGILAYVSFSFETEFWRYRFCSSLCFVINMQNLIIFCLGNLDSLVQRKRYIVPYSYKFSRG